MSKRVEAVLRLGMVIWIAGIQRRTEATQNQIGHEVFLVDHIGMSESRQTAAIVQVQRGPGLQLQSGGNAVLHLLKRRGIGHVIDAGLVGDVLLVER